MNWGAQCNACRFYAELYDYKFRASGSRVCFRLSVKPADSCENAPGIRCCNTHVNKFKIFVDPICQGSIKSVTVNGKATSSVQYERPVWQGKEGFIAKITNMMIPMEDVDNSIICMNLQGKCNSLQDLTPPELKDQNTLEFALYDKKVDDYECCPMFIVDTSPWGGDNGHPFYPNYPRLPPKSPSPPATGRSPKLVPTTQAPPKPASRPPSPRRSPPPPKASPPPHSPKRSPSPPKPAAVASATKAPCTTRKCILKNRK